MTLFTKLTTFLATSAIITLTALFGLSSNAAADCIYQYNPNGFQTSATPVFNKICNVPFIGDESDFVRIRPDVNGNDEDNVNNPAYSIGKINSSCAAGDKFDVWNYIHNNATQGDNPDVGSGSAVAEGTYINMTAPINTTNDSFSFTATVGDTGNLTNTAGPTSTTNMTPAVLDCNGQQVQLTLVPGTVNQYSEYGQTTGPWTNLSQNAAALNTNLAIGSTNAGQSSYNSGTEWGCFSYRIVIVYQVEVTPVSTPKPPTCNYINNDQADIESVNYTANSANDIGFIYNLYSGTSASGTPIATSGKVSQNGYSFSNNLSQGQSYTVQAIVTSSNYSNVTSDNCTNTFTTPTSITTTTTPPPPAPAPTTTTLANTGPGSVVAIFAATSAVASGLYYWVIKRRLARK